MKNTIMLNSRIMRWFGYLLLFLAMHNAMAVGLGGKKEAIQGEILPVNQAFVLGEPIIQDGKIQLHWEIAPGTHLYKHMFKFSVLTENSTVTLGEANIPTGEKKDDPEFGEVEVYGAPNITVTLPYHFNNIENKDNINLQIQVKYQGCADMGLCYPPQKKVFELSLPFNAPSIALSDEKKNLTNNQNNNQNNSQKPENATQIAAKLSQDGVWKIILFFFGAGLLLAFTPCVLPMIPILTGIIVGQGVRSEDYSKWRGFRLSLVYVFASALAFGLLGGVAAFSGQNLQALLQKPAVIMAFGGVFVLLALSMFGLYDLQLPASWQNKLNQFSNQQSGGNLFGAAIMGFLSALIVGPCVTPALAGALLYAIQSGEAIRGAFALFFFGLGMGLPLVLLGTLGGQILPRAGVWMEKVKRFFGFLMLGVALWLVARVLPEWVFQALLSLLCLGFAFELQPFVQGGKLGLLRQMMAWLALVVGSSVIALQVWQYFAPEASNAAPTNTSHAITHSVTANNWQPIANQKMLEQALSEAKKNQQAVMIDYYADWCTNCKTLEKTVFNQQEIQAKFAKIKLLRIDMTQTTPEIQALNTQLQVSAPPTMLFYDANGNAKPDLRIDGVISVADLSNILDQI